VVKERGKSWGEGLLGLGVTSRGGGCQEREKGKIGSRELKQAFASKGEQGKRLTSGSERSEKDTRQANR